MVSPPPYIIHIFCVSVKVQRDFLRGCGLRDPPSPPNPARRSPGPAWRLGRVVVGFARSVLACRLRGLCLSPIPCAAPVPLRGAGRPCAGSASPSAPPLFIQNPQRVLSKGPLPLETTKLGFCMESPPAPRAPLCLFVGRGGLPGGAVLLPCLLVWPSSFSCCAWLARLRPLPVRSAVWVGGRRPVAGFGSPRAVCPALWLRLR